MTMTVTETPVFPSVGKGYSREAVDAAFTAERAWRLELEERAAILLREAAALHLMIATHDAGSASTSLIEAEESAGRVARQVVAEVETKRAPRPRKAPAAAEPAEIPEDVEAREAAEKRAAAAERRKAAAEAKKAAAEAEELKARQVAEKRAAAAERRKAAAEARKAAVAAEQAEQVHLDEAALVRDEVARAAVELAALKEELMRVKALHGEKPSSVPAQGSSESAVVPPAAAAFAASAGAAWARRTSASPTVRRFEVADDKHRTSAVPAQTIQEVPGRPDSRFGAKRVVLAKSAPKQPAGVEEPTAKAPAMAGGVSSTGTFLTPVATTGRTESRVIRLS